MLRLLCVCVALVGIHFALFEIVGVVVVNSTVGHFIITFRKYSAFFDEVPKSTVLKIRIYSFLELSCNNVLRGGGPKDRLFCLIIFFKFILIGHYFFSHLPKFRYPICIKFFWSSLNKPKNGLFLTPSLKYLVGQKNTPLYLSQFYLDRRSVPRDTPYKSNMADIFPNILRYIPLCVVGTCM